MRLYGSRAPRLRWVPAYERTRGPEVVRVAAMAGLTVDPWQSDVLDVLCALSPVDPGMWNTLENTIIVSRQNGKGGAIEAYVLACLFLFDDAMTMYSAHRADTSQQMFERISALVVGCPPFNRRVRRIYEGNGKQSIHLKTGQTLTFHTRSSSAGRGFTGNKLVLDEAFKLEAGMMGALMPTMSAVPNPQISYWSSAGWEISTQLGKLRSRAMAAITHRLLNVEGATVEGIAELLGVTPDDAARYVTRAEPDPSLAHLEWSVPETTQRTKAAMNSLELWAQANPALGIRISADYIAKELRAMGAIEFGRERLGIGDYPPDEDDEGWLVIAEPVWKRLVYPPEVEVRPGQVGGRRPALAVDVKPDLSMASICTVYEDEDGLLVGEVIAHRPGTSWVPDRLTELKAKYAPCAITIDTGGPAAALIPGLEKVGIEVLELTTADVAQAYGQFHEAVTDTKNFRHLDQEPLNDAVQVALTRPLGDRKTWDRKGDGDISPLVAVTNALHAHIRTAHLGSDPMDNIW